MKHFREFVLDFLDVYNMLMETKHFSRQLNFRALERCFLRDKELNGRRDKATNPNENKSIDILYSAHTVLMFKYATRC